VQVRRYGGTAILHSKPAQPKGDDIHHPMGERRSFYVKFDDQECMWIDVPDPEVRIEYTWMETAGLDGREVFAESSQVIHPLLIM
jgi:hypothetical protein